MRKLNRKLKIGIAITPLLILCVVVCMLALYTANNPNETIVISKNYKKGFTFETTNGVQGCFYPRYEIKVTNAFRVKTLHVNKEVWKGVSKWQKYKTKHPLWMYH